MAGRADRRDVAVIEGNPTHEEDAAITTAVLYALHSTAAENGGANHRGEDPDGRPSSSDPNEGDRPEGLDHVRRCPVCGDRYHSRHSLETRRRLAAGGAVSAVCLDPPGGRVFVHRSAPAER